MSRSPAIPFLLDLLWSLRGGFALLAALVVLLALCGAKGRALYGQRLAPNVTTTRYDALLEDAAGKHLPAGWDWLILKAMVRQESKFDPKARSHAGAQGLCQLMPATARHLGLAPAEVRDPERNLDAGARYLREMWDDWPSLPDRPPHWLRTRFALASYNAGPGRLHDAWDQAGRPLTWAAMEPHVPRQTRHYVEQIMDQYYPQLQESSHHRCTGFARHLRRQRRAAATP